MMRLRWFIISVVFSICFMMWSCKKETTKSNFTLQIKGKFGQQAFSFNSPVTDSTGKVIMFNTLQFYLSHINLIKSDGSLVNVAPVALFSFNDSMLTVTGSNVPGNYRGISFSCGLDSLANDTTSPNLYLPPNPLSGSYNMYWPMIKYEFELVEAKWDTAQLPVLRNAIVYHIGTNAAYRTVQLNQNFTVTGPAYNLVLYLDVAQIFNNSTTGESINFVTEPSAMSSPFDNPALLPAFADNFSHAFTFTGP